MKIELDAGRLGDIGAPRPIEVPATRYRQGGREMFHLTVTLAQLTQLIPKRPDPSKPIEGNRRVDPNRAKRFGDYVLERDDWVSPAIIARAPSGEIEFDAVHKFPDGTAWGILRIPLHVLTEILLLDGQHRTLGTFIGLDEINERIRQKRDAVETAKSNGNPAVTAKLQKGLDRAIAQREKLNREHIAVDFAVVSTVQGKQMFVDIANNAKGVNPDFTTILDQRDVINRIAVELIEEHPLLKDRVELGQSTRMTATNPNFIGAKAIADIVRAVILGVRGRVGVRVQDELSREIPAAVRAVGAFLDTITAAFPELADVADGKIEPIELRREDSPHRSMIGSATMLRALGGAFHDLSRPAEVGAGKTVPAMARSEIEVFFASLAPKMREIPIAEDDELWMPTGAFIPGTTAPQARQGTINSLVQSLNNWGRNGHPALAELESREAA
jgi:hypothetical protein